MMRINEQLTNELAWLAGIEPRVFKTQDEAEAASINPENMPRVMWPQELKRGGWVLFGKTGETAYLYYDDGEFYQLPIYPSRR